MEARNKEILEDLDNGRVPLLPFELELASKALDSCVLQQAELGQRLGEAMSQSSETWHDNAPADDVNISSHILSKTAESHISAIANASVFEYDKTSDEVTLGSIVDVEYTESKTQRTLLITGQASRELPEDIKKAIPQDVSVAAVNSPVGRSLLGRREGDEVVFPAPSGKEITIRVISFNQMPTI